jgi:hypothetical protein
MPIDYDKTIAEEEEKEESDKIKKTKGKMKNKQLKVEKKREKLKNSVNKQRNENKISYKIRKNSVVNDKTSDIAQTTVINHKENKKITKDHKKIASTRLQTEKIEIFNCELEKVKEFKMNRFLHTFDMVIGKNLPINNRVQCQFKGNFMLYDENELDNEEKIFMTKNGGFLKNMASNGEVQVRVHVYIIKASIINPFVTPKSERTISLDFGGKNVITEKLPYSRSNEPLIGK